ncbi:MAG: hypothetical protein MUF69_04680 [Desulfobacterota bacterium]|nr:hypothetical protein [Thermodesulfobacteriota bacterium]
MIKKGFKKEVVYWKDEAGRFSLVVKTGIQEEMDSCSLSRCRRDGLRQDDQNK